MADYLKSMKKASLAANGKTVPFHVEEVQSEIGRRGVTHRFPGKDLPFREDLGREARGFNLEAFVIGPNYAAERDRLRDLLENTAGPLLLMHPFWGPMSVSLDGRARITESTTRDLGMARFSIPLVESGAKETLRVALDTRGAVKAKAAAVPIALAKKVKLKPGLADYAAMMTAALRTLNGKIQSIMNRVTNVSTLITAFSDQITELLELPQEFISALYGICTSVLDLIPASDDLKPRAKALAMAIAEGFKAEFRVGSGSTPTKLELSESARSVNRAMKLCTLAAAGSALASITLDSSADAAAFIALFQDRFAELEEDSELDDETFKVAVDLRLAILQHLHAEAEKLPSVAKVQKNVAMPALLLAYEEHGDAMRDEEITARNSISHPLFIPGGQEIEVIRDA